MLKKLGLHAVTISTTAAVLIVAVAMAQGSGVKPSTLLMQSTAAAAEMANAR